jgi:hypothetical protein
MFDIQVVTAYQTPMGHLFFGLDPWEKWEIFFSVIQKWKLYVKFGGEAP